MTGWVAGFSPKPAWAGRAALHVSVTLIAVAWLTPTVGLLVSSFRPTGQLARTGWWTAFQPPLAFTLENYAHVLTTNSLGQAFVNSVLVALPATAFPLALAAIAAYAFAWMDFPGRAVLLAIVTVLLVVPLQMTLIPVLRMLTASGLTGTFLGIWLAHTAYGLPLAIYLLHNAFLRLPREMLEAAEIDGASHQAILLHIVLPTSAPSLAALGIFQFLWVWNDLLVALVFLGGSPDVAPMTVAISNLVNSLGQGWQLLSAAAFVSMIVPLVIFFALQQYFIRGILAGSIKG